MPPLLPELVGYFAAFLTTASFLPQALMIWRTRRTEGISVGMYAIFSTGVFLWLAYGLLARAWPVVAANAVTLALDLWILGMKLRFDGRRSRVTAHVVTPTAAATALEP
ncbi:SemiSWEET transporter [Pendulispora rubella]|uniref:SemiSWEET transporter n=1 Tax=Pendulispora rubella TaxID=2741070 RepID=A0ABZ2KWJ4_9BACT